ncbi:uncharacterized protein LOC131944435 [Physella acuta]|uniref:uncharacterized protein LOC131944435 n=1 Tax=Physella acuta TaxID=109671 RepID=UPI0027DD76F4|nr:uncharacterized protein LOC131944435 [Physella acuta]
MCLLDTSSEDNHTLEAQTIKNKSFFTDIANKLFKKSVRARKIKLAKVLWRRVSHPTGAALYACGILKVLREHETNEDKVQQLKEYYKDFEKYAVDTLMRTYKKYPEETIRLLIFSMPEWGNTTCIYLAINNYNLNFLSQTPCTELNDRLWNWGTHVKNECMWHVKEESEENESTQVHNKEAQGGSFHRSAKGNIGEHSGKLEHCRVCDTCKDHKMLAKLSFWAFIYMSCCCSIRKYDLILRKFLAPSVLVLLQLVR